MYIVTTRNIAIQKVYLYVPHLFCAACLIKMAVVNYKQRDIRISIVAYSRNICAYTLIVY